MNQALIVWGGWDGHQPRQLSEVFGKQLEEIGFDVQVSNILDAFKEIDLKGLDLIVPIWTMGQISGEQIQPVLAAVAGGVGLAGCHGGMCDAFRDNTEWQFMTGGQWVAHPGNDSVRYAVNVVKGSDPIVEGIEDFEVTSEQYYLHVDPAVKVLATTRFPIADGPHFGNGPVDMPVIWTKMWGKGRVFYNSLGHTAAMMENAPLPILMKRGFQWAAGGSSAAGE